MRQTLFLIALCLMTASAFSQHVQIEIPHDLNSKVIKSSENQQKVYNFVEPILSRSYINKRYNFNENQTGSPAFAFFSSLIIPGSGQITQSNWWRAGLFVALEATGIYYTVSNRNKARNGEQDYEKFVDNNWSVVEYSNWLVNYHEVNGISNPYIDDLKSEIAGKSAAFNNEVDWNNIPISLLRKVEKSTPYITTDQQAANNFSHTLPNYGSQQYYELVAKYFQYQGGWRDFNQFHDTIGNTGIFYNERFLIDRTGATASTFFFDAADMASSFNQKYRSSRLFASLLIANHVLSAFDSYFSFRLKQNDLQLSSKLARGQQFTLSYRFN